MCQQAENAAREKVETNTYTAERVPQDVSSKGLDKSAPDRDKIPKGFYLGVNV